MGGLLGLAQGLGGQRPGVFIANDMVSRMCRVLGVAAEGATGELDLPIDVIEGLLQRPYHAQQFWVLSNTSLRWLVAHARCFQVEFAAHCPQLFRHFMGEGLAPELFYCSWTQGLLHGCLAEDELLRLWDLFIFERSHKVFVRTAIALFNCLETRLRGDIDQITKVLFDSQSWAFDKGAVLTRALETKVTRSILSEIAKHDVLDTDVW